MAVPRAVALGGSRAPAAREGELFTAARPPATPPVEVELVALRRVVAVRTRSPAPAIAGARRIDFPVSAEDKFRVRFGAI